MLDFQGLSFFLLFFPSNTWPCLIAAANYRQGTWKVFFYHGNHQIFQEVVHDSAVSTFFDNEAPVMLGSQGRLGDHQPAGWVHGGDWIREGTPQIPRKNSGLGIGFVYI